MSFLSSVLNFGKSAISFLGGNSLGANLAKAAITGYALNKMSSSINKQNTLPAATQTPQIDYGVRVQVNPDTEHRIPIVYGQVNPVLLDMAKSERIIIGDDKAIDKPTFYCATCTEAF
jgi:hypothetical protein